MSRTTRRRLPFLLGLLATVALAACGTCGGACGGAQGARDQTGARREPARATPERTSRTGDLELRVTEVSSSRVKLAWPAARGIAGFEVFVGAEPSTRDDGALSPARRVAELEGDATGTEIEGLAAATDVFLRVEAKDASGAVATWGDTHARTLGGPGVGLDTPLRSVHAYGPRVLMLVLENQGVQHDDGDLEGDLGPRWQDGTWTVERHGGERIEVRAVHRQSYPVSQPGYAIGFEQWGDGDALVLDHALFLELAQPLGERDVLRVEHREEPALSVVVPYSDRYLETPFVQVNQVGYNPRATKRWAYVSGWMGDGGPTSLSGMSATADAIAEPTDPLAERRTVVADIAMTIRAHEDAESGGEVREIDLSRVPAAEGVRYRVRVPGVGVSFPTAVSEESAARAFFTVARGLYHNRFCGQLDEQHTDWSRPRDHCEAFFVTGRHHREGMFPESTPRNGERRIEGGHHDAGDFDIRAFHVVVAQYLMRAYEMEPARFPDGQLLLPESGNGVPDLLDEALYSLAGWEALQNPDGSVRAGIESHRHPAGVYFAHEDRLPYWTFEPEAWHTMYVAALFAQGARLVGPFDAGRSERLKRAAVAAWEWAHPRNPPKSYRLYAASELARLTGEARFDAEVKTCWRELDQWGRGAFDAVQPMPKVYDGAFEQYSPAMADFVMGYVGWEGADPEIVRVTHAQLLERADRAAAAILDSPHAHRNGRPPNEPRTWGQSTTTGRHADFLYQALSLRELDPTRRQRYLDAMSVAADYALGCNPASYVWITGLGSRSPLEPVHLDSLVFVRRGMPPVPGIPIFGPVEEIPGASYYAPIRASFAPAYARIPGGRRVSDTHASVNMNEFSVWTQQAPMALLFAALAPTGEPPPASWRPGGPMHRSTLPSHTRDAPPVSESEPETKAEEAEAESETEGGSETEGEAATTETPRGT